jgi:ribonuclease T2
MNKYWIAQNQPNPTLWAHEFSKHATCFSTFDVPCYGPKYVEHEEIIDFFDTVVKYFLREPTYDWLAAKGIKPSNSTGYSLSEIQGVLAEAYGAVPYVGCAGPRYNETEAGKGSGDSGRTGLSEVWYFSFVSLPSISKFLCEAAVQQFAAVGKQLELPVLEVYANSTDV